MTHRLFCYYGDDFTGSTDALEALASNGVPTVLFLDPPLDEMLARFPDCRAIGVAGESRSRDPQWMTAHLPAIFARLAQLRACICHYKVCSTFDSSPECGSIGRAIEIGQDVFSTPWVPVVVAAPHLDRYVLFGNLFAAGGGTIHRIDRHPTMRHHPVTPMDEGDLRVHLARQTSRKIALLDILSLGGKDAEERLEKVVAEKPAIVLFDGLDDRTLRTAGRILWTRRPARFSFAAGSSGLIHALVEQWRESGEIPSAYSVDEPGPVDRTVVVSGSCSPVTEGQIRWAIAHGFAGIRVDAAKRDNSAALNATLSALGGGQSVVLYTAIGAEDRNAGKGGEELGHQLGVLLREVLIRSGVRRAVVAGGDTSSHAVRQLGIESLTFAGPLTPGAPLCRCHAPGSVLDGLELVLKGGQVGPENFFEMIRNNKG
ncbi:MAG: four-carbon acid sugar kinase family protein [Bryobacteraceae bacterium]